MRRSLWPAAAGLALLGMTPAAGLGQSRVELVPFFASYFPVTALKDTTDIHEKQTVAALLGARLVVRLGPTIRTEFALGYTQSQVASEQPSGLPAGSLVNTQDGHILFPSLRVVFQPRRASYFGYIGGGAVLRRGKGWPKSVYKKRDAIGGVLGLGVRPQLSRNIDLVFNVELNVYRLDADGGGTAGNYYKRTTQKDVIVATGVPIGLFGR